MKHFCYLGCLLFSIIYSPIGKSDIDRAKKCQSKGGIWLDDSCVIEINDNSDDKLKKAKICQKSGGYLINGLCTIEIEKEKETKSSVSNKEGGKEEERKEETILKRKSIFKHNISILAGSAYKTSIGGGLQYLYQLFPNLQFGFRSMSGTDSEKKSITSDNTVGYTTKRELRGTNTQLMARYFFDDSSFFIMAGLGYKVVSLEYTATITKFNGKPCNIEEKFSGTSEVSALTLGIGNKWQWDNGFSLGVDWYGMFFNLGKSNTTESVLEQNGTDTNGKGVSITSGDPKLDELLNKENDSPGDYALLLSIGYSF